MQCANCRFQNMPGTAACIRCGASLQLGAIAIDVHPPRAGALARALRRWIPWRRVFYPLRDMVAHRGGALERSVATAFDAAPLRAGTVLRLIVPGWAQRHQGQTQRGKIYFGIWSALFSTGLMSFGSTLASLMFGLAIAVHAGSILDLLLPASDRTPRQIMVRGAIILAAMFGLYIPLNRAVLHFIEPRQWQQDAGPFASGDVVLLNPRAYRDAAPQAGDIVLFRDAPWSVPGRGNHLAVFGQGGDGMDRILAGPGSIICWKNGELWVDGQRSELRPLNRDSLPDQPDLLVPAGMYYIVHSTNPALQQTMDLGLLHNLVLHRQETILGKAIVRHYPIWRWWWMN